MDVLAEALSVQLQQANRQLRERLNVVTDDEYLWEPVPDCWNVRPREEIRSSRPMGRGPWLFDSAEADPSPAPFTTIAWRLMHLTDALGSYHAFLWGDGQMSDDWLEIPSTAAD